MNTVIAEREIDWPAIEQAYREGRDTLRVIAARYGVTHGAINKRASRDDWERDLSWRIAAKTVKLVSKDAVKLVSKASKPKTGVVSKKPVSKAVRITEAALVDANAELQANVIRGERKSITRLRKLADAQTVELESAPDAALPQRIDMLRKLADTMDKLIAAERKVFNIRDGEPVPTPGAGQVMTINLVAMAGVAAR